MTVKPYVVPEADSGPQFAFKFGAKSYSVPFVEDLPLERLEALNAMRGVGSSDMNLRELTALLFGDEAGAVVYQMSAKQFQGLVEAWEGASSATVGESDPSDG